MSFKNVLTVVFLLVCFSAQAGEVITTVFNVFESQRTNRLLVLSAADGRIYKAPGSKEALKLLKTHIGKVVHITYHLQGEEALIAQIRPVHEGELDTRTMDLNYFQYNELRQFAPTNLQSKEEVETLFSEMLNDGDRRRSQCFKRAHIWTYDMWSKLGLSTQKIFIFYTRRYALLEDFDWWFHVAPLVMANDEEYVLDGTFMKKPVTVKEWQHHFIKSTKITCPSITHYSQYEDHQWNRLCYLMKTPMFYFSPLDIEKRDKNGVYKNHWVLEELQDSRRAFKNWENVYEGLDTGRPTITH